jgi:trans-aconitate methyltransferase
VNVLYQSEWVRVFEGLEADGETVRKIAFGPSFSCAQGVIRTDDPSFHVQEYTRQLTYAALCAKQGVGRALFLGLGAGIVVNAVRTLFPSATIDVVDISHEIFKVAHTHFFNIDAGNVNHFHDDANAFVQKTKQRYDFICCDLWGMELDVPHFLVLDPQFYRSIKAISAPGGVCAVNTSSLVHKSICEHLTSVYRHVVSMEGDNTLLIASDVEPRATADAATLSALAASNVDVSRIEERAILMHRRQQ